MNVEKDKLLLILRELSNHKMEEDFVFQLTINLEEKIRNSKDLSAIKSIVEQSGVNNFNLTIINWGTWDEERYEKYYYNVDFVFCTDGSYLTFHSPYLSNREVKLTSVKKMFEVFELFKKTSKEIYDIVLEK